MKFQQLASIISTWFHSVSRFLDRCGLSTFLEYPPLHRDHAEKRILRFSNQQFSPSVRRHLEIHKKRLHKCMLWTMKGQLPRIRWRPCSSSVELHKINGHTWIANSRVGAKTRAWGNRPRCLLSSFSSFSTVGSANDRVFPITIGLGEWMKQCTGSSSRLPQNITSFHDMLESDCQCYEA